MSSLSKKEKLNLLNFARENIAWKLGLRSVEPELKLKVKPSGAFVTLHEDGRLRGCIGQIVSENPLSVTISRMAAAAAFEDPRFSPLGKDEFERISIEISILSPLEKVTDLEKIKTGRDGLLVRKGFHSGLLLPQVATEQNWDRETFINQTFYKAGLIPSAIKDSETEIFSFTAEVFREEDL